MEQEVEEEGCALKLVQKAKLLKDGGLSEFTTFEETLVSSSIRTIRQLHEVQARDLENPYVDISDTYFSSKLAMIHAQMNHTKRCLACYFKQRMNSIMDAWWSYNVPQIRQFMHAPHEVNFEAEFSSLVVEYMSTLKGLDLHQAVAGPPPLQRNLLVCGRKTASYVSPNNGCTIEVYENKCMSLTYEDAMLLVADNAVHIMNN